MVIIFLPKFFFSAYELLSTGLDSGGHSALNETDMFSGLLDGSGFELLNTEQFLF